MRLTHDDFIRLLKQRFPDVAAAIDDCSEGLLHLEMATFSRATENAIRTSDWQLLQEHYRFAEQLHRNGNADVLNAVNVSYLENLPLYLEGKQYDRALALMSPYLRKAWVDMQAYLDKLHGSSTIDDLRKQRRL